MIGSPRNGMRSGNPVRIRDGPAAVRGDAPRRQATGLRAGKAAKREPRVRRPTACRQPEPLAEGGFVFPTTHDPGGPGRLLCGARRGRPRVNVKVRVEGETQDDLRRCAADDRHDRRIRAGHARGRQLARRVLLPRHAVLVRAVRRPDRALQGRGLGRLDVQGQRRLAAGRGRQGAREGRRRRPLVLDDVRAHGRAADAGAQANQEELLRRDRAGRHGSRPGRGRGRPTGRRQAPLDSRGRACIGRHVGLVRAIRTGAVRSNALR